MSISQDSAATIVCREVFDETSHPTNEELLDYAKRLGIDPDAEPHLLDLAREGLMAALPKGWSPCFHEASGAWYYYQASTGTTTWEHPLDAVYRGLVEQARMGNKRQMSLEEDSKTTAKDLESHEDATLPKETLKEPTTPRESTKETNHPKPAIVGTKIPMKLAPLRKIERIDGSRKRDRPSSFDRLQSRRESDSKSDNIISLSSDRASRDYTNLKFQDPKFYECPKLLEKADTIATTTTTVPAKKELDLKEVLKRSESLSPWHEKDWEQLSSKFSSEENIIDIDKLSASTLARPERPEKFDKEKHPSQLGQQKELTLSGGGSMFLKSNRSRDNTPSQDGGKLEDFQALMISDEINNAGGDRPKSILREKQLDDDDRPLDEERKSVRFDLEKEINFNFTYSESEDDWESESEDKNLRISAVISNKITGSILSPRKPTSEDNDDNKNDYSEKDQDKMDSEINKQHLPLEKIESISKNTKLVGKRFLVQNVSENEHHNQMTSNQMRNSLEMDNSLDYLPNKLSEKVKNIDLISKSETDCSTAKSSDSDEIRRTRSIIEKARHVTNRLSNWQLEDDESSDISKISQHYAQKERFVRPKLEYSRSIDDMKMKMNREHEREIEAFKIELEVKLQEKKKELEENFAQQKLLLQQYLDQKLEEVKQEMAQKEEQEIQALITEMDQARIENLKKVRTELEVCYEKERQEILTNLKTELDERKRELLELRNQEMGKLENEHERDLGEEKLAKLNEYELRKQQTESIELLKKELEKELEDLRNELRTQQREKITKFTEDHEQCLAEILRDFRMDEALARKMYKERLEEIRADFARETEKEARKQNERILQDSIDFEKMRCEKRLLQDKYTALKEKYMKLKNDVRLAVERRSRRKEGYTTASETERSTSTRTKTDRTESSEQNTPLKNASSSPVTNAKSQEGQSTSEQVGEQNDPDNSRSQRAAAGFQKHATPVTDSKSATKFESDDTTTASETNTNMMMMMKKKKSFSKKVASNAGRSSGGSNNNPVENPVENIRKQLKKLEDLGDQLPSNETAYTVRYPFQDKAPANASSELEFFRHRIHVERDSVRRAREALRQQRSAFQGRQRAWKQRSARATLEQLVQEERELSDMEVSLHRTRSLLGEKVIHLRHLEQSLERVANDKRNENDASSIKNDELTLSDMSSASSGFSSTDLGTDTFIDKPDHYQESTEIIASLENLNSEIREIWDVLNKRQDNNIPPTPALMYSYLRWLRFHHLTTQPNSMQGAFGTPNIQSNILSQLTAAQPPTTTTQNIIAQYGPNSGFTTSVGTVERNASNLMERTRNLRDWLRQARVETTDLISPGQATL
ncbi:Centrosomal protein of 164 kDa [Camponotus floridanus]|uniref:Centrosomal protein of 164 kDa n=2 Tax=Camponotus floridanus TaxID=104421 RepID=E2AL58_CAMFO|nr:centrosomal protein of 164 kDa isoform X1 [Camponotus floridanus]EFN65813.1 Centrosomal protein of 164 kDa [Camponotus floridanus]